MKILLAMLAAAASVACGLVRSYSVEPRTAAESGWTDTIPGRDYVSEVLTVNFDLLDSTSGAYCELFAGTKGAGGQYHVAVLTYPGGFPIGSGDADGEVDHQWTKFKIGVQFPESIVKGKRLEFRFTRSGSDSIQYYTNVGTAYTYGFLRTGGV